MVPPVKEVEKVTVIAVGDPSVEVIVGTAVACVGVNVHAAQVVNAPPVVSKVIVRLVAAVSPDTNPPELVPVIVPADTVGVGL